MQLGLVQKVVDADLLDKTLQDISKKLLTINPKTLAHTKELISHVANKPIDDTLVKDTAQRIAKLRVSTEGQAGIKRFLAQ